jgi:putative transposase
VVYEEVNATRGIFRELDPNVRRIHLGWEVKVIPSDEGVKVFGGLYYSSPKLPEKTDKYRGKVSVFVDPEDVTHATVLIPGEKDPVEVTIQNTVFADLTLPEVLEIMAAWRKEHPDVTVIYEDRLMRTRRRMFDQLRSIGVERKLARSYSTVRECQMKGEVVFAGTRIETAGRLPGTIAPGNLTAQHADGAIFKLGAGTRAAGVAASSRTVTGPMTRSIATVTTGARCGRWAYAPLRERKETSRPRADRWFSRKRLRASALQPRT